MLRPKNMTRAMIPVILHYNKFETSLNTVFQHPVTIDDRQKSMTVN